MRSSRESVTFTPYQPPVIPSWATAESDGLIGAAFAAGAGLNSIDSILRADPAWIGVWRQRLALRCAGVAVRLAGRGEDEAALRDAFVLRRAGDDLGPAGNVFMAWKRLTSLSGAMSSGDTGLLREVAGLLGLNWGGGLVDLAGRADDLGRSGRAAPLAAADAVSLVFSLQPDAEILGWWLADRVLAKKLGWQKPVPLLMAQRYSPAFRAGAGRGKVIRPDAEGFDRAICLALTESAAEACRLALDLSRRAELLIAVAPRLRAKGAGEAIQMLLEEDAVSGSLQTAKLSRWASRRLFERLGEFQAVRELSGRTSFRIYGL